jgi:hypothetical protein
LLNQRRHPPALRPTLRDGRLNFNCTLADIDCADVFNDDLAIPDLQYSTQWALSCESRAIKSFLRKFEGFPDLIHAPQMRAHRIERPEHAARPTVP